MGRNFSVRPGQQIPLPPGTVHVKYDKAENIHIYHHSPTDTFFLIQQKGDGGWIVEQRHRGELDCCNG